MTKLSPTGTGLLTLVITGWPGSGVGVGVLAGVKVGITVGGPVTENCAVAVAASSVELPANFAVCAVTSGVAGVSLHDAMPLASVVPTHELPCNESCTLTPDTGTAGLTEMSLSAAVNVTALPAIAPAGLRLSVRKLVCLPTAQVITL